MGKSAGNHRFPQKNMPGQFLGRFRASHGFSRSLGSDDLGLFLPAKLHLSGRRLDLDGAPLRPGSLGVPGGSPGPPGSPGGDLVGDDWCKTAWDRGHVSEKKGEEEKKGDALEILLLLIDI